MRGDYAVDEAHYIRWKQNLSNLMIITYITWQVMYLNGTNSSYDPSSYE